MPQKNFLQFILGGSQNTLNFSIVNPSNPWYQPTSSVALPPFQRALPHSSYTI